MPKPEFVKLKTTTSTQLAAADLPMGSVVVADQQTAGRGRLGRAWENPPKTALLATFVLEPRPLLSLACGVAAAEACGPQVRLKWPNDLMLGEAKVGGILVEVRGGRALVGIGINLTWAPPGAAMLGQDRDQLLKRMQPLITRWSRAGNNEILQRWRQLSATLGRPVRVVLPEREVMGIATDIDPSGALVVGEERFHAGDVIHLLQQQSTQAEPRPPAP